MGEGEDLAPNFSPPSPGPVTEGQPTDRGKLSGGDPAVDSVSRRHPCKPEGRRLFLSKTRDQNYTRTAYHTPWDIPLWIMNREGIPSNITL